MLDHIISFSIKNKLIIGIMVLALIAWGTYSVNQLPIDAVPDITNNQVMVMTVTPSLAAQEVERLITFPVEKTMTTIPGIEEIRSFSRFGLSLVTIVFKDNVEIYWARQQVSERLKQAEAEIPKGIGTPELGPVTTGLGEIYQYVVHTKPGFENKYSAMDLRTIQDWIVRRQLLGTPGVAEVSTFGGLLKQYEISLDPDKLRSMNLSIHEIFTALQKNNQNTGGAYIEKSPNAYFIRTEGLIGGINDIENVLIKSNPNGIPVLIKDVAKVHFGHAIRYGASTRNGEGEVVSGIVMMLKGENSSKVIGHVKEKIKEIQKMLPEGVVIEPYLDRAKLVNHAIKTVVTNLAEGALIVVFVLVLLLGNIRAGLVVASVIPFAMLFAISMMNLFGVSGNLMSLGAIDFGLIVDGAVIIVESILHRLAINNTIHNRLLTQQEMDAQVYESASKIRTSAAFGEIIILIVYLPILALVGIEGKMFKPMAQTVSFAIIGAFILSLTYVPMASALFLSKRMENKRNISDRIMDFFQKIYAPLINHALNKKVFVIVISIALFVVSMIVFLNMGGEFIPTLDEGDFAVETRVMTGSSILETIEATEKASRILLEKFPDVEQVVGKIGSGEIPTDPMPIEASDIMIILKERKEWTSAKTRDELAEKMSEALSDIPGVTFGFQQPIQMRFNELMTGAKQDVIIKVYGEDLDILSTQASKVGKLIQPIEGVEDLYIEEITGLPQINIKFNRANIAALGLNIEDINNTINTAFAGNVAGAVYEGEKRFDMVVRLEKSSRSDLENVKNLFVSAPNGNQIPLEQLADVTFKVGPNQIQRDDTKRRIIVGFNVRNRDVESIIEEIKLKIEKRIKLPAGYHITYGGQFENLVKAKQRLSIAVPIALLLIFVLLYFTFNSIKHSLLIFSAIPFSAIGGIFALWIRGMPFSISAGIGFIALFGVSVLNGIVLISYFNQLKSEGNTDIKEIILLGTRVRLRPVIMTALVASLGFLPMALSNSSGAEVQKPLATVVIGGLISATLLTLLVLPVLYYIFEAKERGDGLRGRWSKSTRPVVVTLLLILIAITNSSAQNLGSELTLEKAVETALSNNPSIKSTALEVDLQKKLKGAASDIGKTNIGVMVGQTNSTAIDNYLEVNQAIPFPTVLRNQLLLSRSHIRSSEIQLRIAENELKYNVKRSYFQLAFFKAKARHFQSLDSLYDNFVRASDLRYKTGEANLLEKAFAESQSMEIKSLLQQNQSDIAIWKSQLQTLLNIDVAVDIADVSFYKIPFNPNSDSISVENNAAVAYYKQQLLISDRSKALQKSKLMPDLSIGYFNQTLRGYHNVDGTDRYYGPDKRFMGVQAGVSIPLWAGPHIYRIRAAEVSQKIAQANLQSNQKILEGQYRQLMEAYSKHRTNLEYYEKNALPQANLILKQAQLALRNGAIGYVEYIQALGRVSTIRSNSLEALNSYNQSILSIQLILGDI